MEKPKYWLSVVSKEHILNGIKNKWIMVCHGKERPLKRMKEGDWLINYSPTEKYGDKKPYQCFTGFGQITDGKTFQHQMDDSFHPFGMKIDWKPSNDISVRPYLKSLKFITNPKQWGFKFRLGHFEIPKKDFLLLTQDMHKNET